MAEREETLMAETPAELAAALGALRGSIVAVGRPRQVATGHWYVRVRAHQSLTARTPPAAVSPMRIPRTLVAAIVTGGAAVVALLVMVTAWVVRHWAVTLGVLVLVLAGWIFRQGRMHR